MPLIKEDGSGVEGADTFVTAEELRAFSLKRGTTLSQTDAQVEAALVKALDLLEHHENDFDGVRVLATLPFPRTDSTLFTDTEIPKCVTDAQCVAALASLGGIDLLPVTTGQRVLKRKVDVIETQFADTDARTSIPAFISRISRVMRQAPSIIVDRV